MKILKFIKKYFKVGEEPKKMEDFTESEFCIIGNIVDKHFYGEQKEIRRGTKHFRPNAKVYCLPEFGGMGHETMVVVGVPRKSKRFIKIALPTKRIKNFKVKAVYKPRIIDFVRENIFYHNWKKIDKEDKNKLQEFVDYLNEMELKNRTEKFDNFRVRWNDKNQASGSTASMMQLSRQMLYLN